MIPLSFFSIDLIFISYNFRNALWCFGQGMKAWKHLFCRKNKEDFLRNLARDNTQLLFNAIWKVQSIPSIVNQTLGNRIQLSLIIQPNQFDFQTSRTQSKKSNPNKLNASLKNMESVFYTEVSRASKNLSLIFNTSFTKIES